MEERRQRRRRRRWWLVFVGFSWIQRRGRNVASRLIWRSSFVGRRHYPSLLTVCFHGLLGEFFLKPHYRREGKNTTKGQEEKRGRCMEEVVRPGSRASTIPPFRVCRLLAKPEKTAVLAPPLRSMKIKCRCFLRTVLFYFCLDSWVWQEMDELRGYGRKWSRSRRCQFDIADRYI